MANINTFLTFLTCIKNNNLELLKTLSVTKKEAKSYGNYAFVLCASLGYIDVLKYLTETFNITEVEAKIEDNFALICAATNGHLEILKYLMETFNITDNEIKKHNGYILACVNGNKHNNSLKYLKETFKISEIVCSQFYEIARNCPTKSGISCGHLPL